MHPLENKIDLHHLARFFTSTMAEQKARSWFGSWFSWTNPASSPRQRPQPPQRPLSQPQVPSSSTQLQPKPPSRSTSQPQPSPQTASQTPSQSHRDTQLQQTTKTASKSSPPEPNAQSQPATRTPTQPPPPSPTFPPQQTAKTSSRPPSRSHTSQSQGAAQTAFQPPSPSQTASQPKPDSSSSPSPTGPQQQTATRAASQPQSSSRANTRSQTAARSGSRTATPTSTGSQSQPENLVPSHSPNPSRASSQSQPANMMVSKPVSPSQTGTKTLPTTRRVSEPARTVSQPQTLTQTSFQLPSPSHMASQSQPATKSTSQPPSRTASLTPTAATMTPQAVPRSPASIPSQQSRQRESRLSSSSAISPSKPKSTSSPSTVSPKPKAPSSKMAEPQPVLSQTLSKDSQAIAANSELVLEPQNQIQKSGTRHRTTETTYLQAYMENEPYKPTEVATSMPMVPYSSTAALETSTPQTEEFTAAPDSNNQSPKAEEEEETINERREKEIEASQDETPELPHMVSGSKTTAGTQSEATTQPSEELTTKRTKHKDQSTKSEAHLKVSTSGEQALLKQEIRDGVSKFIQKLDAGNPKHHRNGVSVITFAGENKGASMNAGPDAVNKDNYLYIRRDYKLEKEDEREVSSGTESNSKLKSNCPSGLQGMFTCINNNVQSINNSLLYDSSCSERNPGLHLELSLKQTKPIILKKEMEPSEAQKDKFTITPAQKLKPEPTVRRRCLRGLFMEPSESDPDNPQKPRRHGCRYTCPEKGKGKEEGN